jgi:ADP-ribosyl-[dinitrogen reductase] hydrolase
MSLCIARSLVVYGFSAEDIARRFADWLRSKPKDVGNTCRRGITRYVTQGSVHGPYNDGDAGNGAAMRMAPIALAALANVATLESMAVGQGHITHHHPLSDQACILVGKLIQLALLGHSIERLRNQAEATIAMVPNFRFMPFPGLSTAYVVDTIQTVLHVLFSTSSFEDCLVTTVNQGGDADTTGAIVGAIAGAYYGIDAIPKDWIKKLDTHVREELQDLSERLITISPLGQGQAVTMFPPTEKQGG